MGRKIFVSYKYHDKDVYPLAYYSLLSDAKARDYVSLLEHRLKEYSDNIFKGEQDNEDLSYLSEDSIWEKLKDRLYDSSVTIVMISPNMKEYGRWERNQWIPWEIAYSLRKATRNGRTSQPNAILGVILPDRFGMYEYYDSMKKFEILDKNIKNGYIPVVKWYRFIDNMEQYINMAILAKGQVSPDQVVKSI